MPTSGLTNPQQETFSIFEQAEINKIENYLNWISTLQTRFIQIDPSGSFAEGDMFLKRPGRMRFQYDPPAKLLLIADGVWFIYVDLELRQVTHLPLSSTPAAFLLQDNFTFGAEYAIRRFSKKDDLTKLEIFKIEEPDIGSVELIFQNSPLQLRQWVITDAQGLQTLVTFTNVQTNIELDSELFSVDASKYRDN